MILDAGTVIALARGDDRARSFLARAVDLGAEVFIPAVAVAETVRGRGPRDASVNRVIGAVESVLPTDEPTARIAGRLLGDTRSDATVDALVVATAVHVGGGRILTSDPGDLRLLARGSPEVAIHSV